MDLGQTSATKMYAQLKRAQVWFAWGQKDQTWTCDAPYQKTKPDAYDGTPLPPALVCFAAAALFLQLLWARIA